ncbi:MAG TPA: hypothetical protein VKU19_26495 [Bryobacteraceae bacterium]|nr:hypothetical protein [Bryobacteraceae bacterium]
MMKATIIAMTAACGAATMLAQGFPQRSAFQQSGWIAAPGSSLASYPTLRPAAQSGPVAGKPLSAMEVRHTVQTLGDGTHVQDSSSSLFYRDAQGRMRSESPTQALIYDPVAGVTYQLDMRAKTFWKGPIRDAVVSIATIGNRTSISSGNAAIFPASGGGRGEMAPGKAQHKALVTSIQSHATTEELPAQMINGIYSHGSRITETIPAGTFGNDRDIKIVSERWFSDDLQVLVKSSNSDPRFGVTTYELTNISQAPPDPGQFQVPVDYTPVPVRAVGGGVAGTAK